MRSPLIPNSSSSLPQKKSAAPITTTAPVIKEVPLVQRKACSCGGNCPRCAGSSAQLKTKLPVSKPNDPAEQQADQVAEQVMQSNSEVSAINQSQSTSLQKKSVSTKKESTKSADSAVPQEQGAPLDESTRSFMEPRFGKNFSDVRVHTGDKAEQSSHAVNAKAYTIGSDIVFGEGQYSPDTSSGKELLAHELTHVVQQSEGGTHQISREPRSLQESLNATVLLDEELLFEITEIEEWLAAHPVNNTENDMLASQLDLFKKEAIHRSRASEKFKKIIKTQPTVGVLKAIKEGGDITHDVKSTPRKREEVSGFIESLKAEAETRKQPVTSPTTVAKAIEYLEEAEQWDKADPRDGQRVYDLLYSVEQFTGNLYWGGKVRDAFYGKGLNYTYSDTLCNAAYSEVSSAVSRLRVEQRPLRGFWPLIIGRMKGAKEYFEVANKERTFEQSPVATAVKKWQWTPLLMAGGLFAAFVLIGLGAPLIAAELELMGSAAVSLGQAAWGLYLANPLAGLAVAEFALGTIITIGSVGLDGYIEQMKTPQGVLLTIFEIMIIKQQMGNGGYNQYKGRVTPRGGDLVDVEIIEGPVFVPGKTTTTTVPPKSTSPNIEVAPELPAVKSAPTTPAKPDVPAVEVAPVAPPVTNTAPATKSPIAKPTAPPVEAAPVTPPVIKSAPAAPVKPAAPAEVAPETLSVAKPAPAAVPKTVAPPEAVSEVPPIAKPNTAKSTPAPEASDQPAKPAGTTAAPKPDPYVDLDLKKLKKLSATDPEAAEALRLRYRNMPDKELNRRANDGDAMAKSVRDQRVKPNTPLATQGRGQGNFSKPGVQSELEADIEAARAKSGIRRTGRSAIDPDADVEGGTMGAARTDVEGLEKEKFTGGSPQAGGKVNPDSDFKPATDAKTLPQTHGHAEQQIADQLAPALKKIPPEKLKGKTVWMLIEQEPCSTCASGVTDPTTAAGVLRKLSEMFPELTFQIKNLNTSGVITLRNGQVVN